MRQTSQFFSGIFAVSFFLVAPYCYGDLSGHWDGIYIYGPNAETGAGENQSMDINPLGDDQFNGTGNNDVVGDFTVVGTYSEKAQTLQYVKHYQDHTVSYQGTYTDTEITGTWSIDKNTSGTFQFWREKPSSLEFIFDKTPIDPEKSDYDHDAALSSDPVPAEIDFPGSSPQKNILLPITIIRAAKP